MATTKPAPTLKPKLHEATSVQRAARAGFGRAECERSVPRSRNGDRWRKRARRRRGLPRLHRSGRSNRREHGLRRLAGQPGQRAGRAVGQRIIRGLQKERRRLPGRPDPRQRSMVGFRRAPAQRQTAATLSRSSTRRRIAGYCSSRYSRDRRSAAAGPFPPARTHWALTIGTSSRRPRASRTTPS